MRWTGKLKNRRLCAAEAEGYESHQKRGPRRSCVEETSAILPNPWDGQKFMILNLLPQQLLKMYNAPEQ